MFPFLLILSNNLLHLQENIDGNNNIGTIWIKVFLDEL